MATAITPLENYIIGACQQNTALKGVLATLANGLPAVMVGTLDQWDVPVYPSLTFRINTAKPDPRFEDPLGGAPTAPVEDYRVDFEAWAQADSTSIVTILDALDTLFRNQSATLAGGGVSLANALAFRITQLTLSPVLYDAKTQAMYGLASYLFRLQR